MQQPEHMFTQSTHSRRVSLIISILLCVWLGCSRQEIGKASENECIIKSLFVQKITSDRMKPQNSKGLYAACKISEQVRCNIYI